MDKYGRNYKLTIQKNSGGDLVVTPPLTVEFSITRSYFSDASISSFKIYNLSQSNRNEVRKDRDLIEDIEDPKGKLINFQAGYGNNLPLAFNGTVADCFSVRTGTNYITHIEAFDTGGFLENVQFDHPPFAEGTPYKNVIDVALSSMQKYGIGKGAIGAIEGSTTRKMSYSGSSVELIKGIVGNNFFIDNGVAHILKDGEARKGTINEISAETGLLGTPTRYLGQITIDLLFEPRIVIGQWLKVASVGEFNFAGTYKVASIQHKGTISENVGGMAITTLVLDPIGAYDEVRG